MLKIENFEVVGWEHAIRGMRNPMNSWEKSDSKHCTDHYTCDDCSAYKDDGKECKQFGCVDPFIVGPNDHKLMTSLAKGGPVHAKYRRMIVVYADITAPLYWWKEFDTYKVGTVANSCSTMHKIHAKEFTLDDFSHEHLLTNAQVYNGYVPTAVLECIIGALNEFRALFLETKDKRYWWQMIQLLPTSYNQKRTVMIPYEVLANVHPSRRHHKLDEWHVFCDWIEQLPYSELITMKNEAHDEKV